MAIFNSFLYVYQRVFLFFSPFSKNTHLGAADAELRPPEGIGAGQMVLPSSESLLKGVQLTNGRHVTGDIHGINMNKHQ